MKLITEDLSIFKNGEQYLLFGTFVNPGFLNKSPEISYLQAVIDLEAVSKEFVIGFFDCEDGNADYCWRAMDIMSERFANFFASHYCELPNMKD